MPKQKSEERIEATLESQKSIELFKQQISKIDQLLTMCYDDPEVNKWDNFTEQLIIKTFGKPHDNLNAFYSSQFGGPIFGGMSTSQLQQHYIKARENIRKLLEGFVEQLEAFAPIAAKETLLPNTQKQHSRPISNKVFIVHGHDDKAKTELALILTRLKLDPVILHEQASEGMTVIEKLEKHSDVGFAFVLLTPDDMGKEQGDTNEKPRARQNVVFEFGLFVGKLGRKSVCCLYTGDTELPTDLRGLVYIPYKTSVNEVQLDIVKELRAAGHEISL